MKLKLSHLTLSMFLFSAELFADIKQITVDEIKQVQKEWANEIVKIGELFEKQEDYKTEAKNAINKLYGYSEGQVLFKPTKASIDQFRETPEEALSYFVTGIEAEDHGFAIHPWTYVRFDNNEQIYIDTDSAISMGNYYFTDKNGKEIKVEFTFGYKRAKDSRLVIFLHHSSLPFSQTSIKHKHKS
jgi:hypothetical protein